MGIDIEQLVSDQADPHIVRCASCGKTWTSRIYAEDCADQDEMEEDDREHGRFYRSNN